MASAVLSIRELGLAVAAEKIEAMFFYDRLIRPPPPNMTLAVE